MSRTVVMYSQAGTGCWFSEKHIDFCRNNTCNCCTKRFNCYTDRDYLVLKAYLNEKEKITGDDSVLRGEYYCSGKEPEILYMKNYGWASE